MTVPDSLSDVHNIYRTFGKSTWQMSNVRHGCEPLCIWGEITIYKTPANPMLVTCWQTWTNANPIWTFKRQIINSTSPHWPNWTLARREERRTPCSAAQQTYRAPLPTELVNLLKPRPPRYNFFCSAVFVSFMKKTRIASSLLKKLGMCYPNVVAT